MTLVREVEHDDAGQVKASRFRVERGLGASATTIPADGKSAAMCHYAGEASEKAHHWWVTWPGHQVTESRPAFLDPGSGLSVSERAVTAAEPGELRVECNGAVITIQATEPA